MNRLVRVALVLAATLAVTMPAQALEDVRGWRNTTWKMNESEVKRSVGALGLVVTPAPRRRRHCRPPSVPFKTKVDIDGSEYDVAFHFLDDPRQLGRVQVGGQDAPREDALRRHASLLRTLTDRLGAPSETDSRGSPLVDDAVDVQDHDDRAEHVHGYRRARSVDAGGRDLLAHGTARRGSREGPGVRAAAAPRRLLETLSRRRGLDGPLRTSPTAGLRRRSRRSNGAYTATTLFA